jgi:3',5'-cyclic AMP phosphodiesterase CpdA
MLHVPEALAGIVADIKAQQPDHIALTGDRGEHLAPTEFARAADWLATLGGPDAVTVIPGNHDVYVADRLAREPRPVGAYIGRRRPPPATTSTSSRRCAGAAGCALVWLSSGVPKPPCLATGTLGDAQIAKARAACLADLAREGLCRVVLIHHRRSPGKRASSASPTPAAFQAMIRRVGCELVLHGHNHRSESGAHRRTAGRFRCIGSPRLGRRPTASTGARALPPHSHRA